MKLRNKKWMNKIKMKFNKKLIKFKMMRID